MMVGLLIMGVAFGYAFITSNLPSIDLFPELLDPVNGSLLQPSRIYDRTGKHLLLVLSPLDAPRTYVSIDESQPTHIPQSLVKSTVALVDPDIWIHPGFRFENLSNPNEHSTLAQKLVSNLLLWNEPASLRRAIRERILAAQITARFGRQKIIEWYLNSANYGHYAFGAESASELYLGKPVDQVNLAEAALLAAINESPAINPLDAPQATLQRQKEVLKLIEDRGIASAKETTLARSTEFTFQKASQQPGIAPAFTVLALSQLEKQFNRARIEQGGLQVLTTLDFGIQSRTDCVVQTQLSRVDRSAEIASQPCAGAEMLPPLPPGQNVSLSASAVVLDPRNGQLLALIGDSEKDSRSFFLTPHRPRSLLTPFIYLAGFTRGLSPATMLWDIPGTSSITVSEQDPAAQQGLERLYQGPVRLRSALANDSLTIADQLFNQMGASLVQQTMNPFGLNIPANNLQALLETENRYSVIQIGQVFSIFATQGALNGQKSPDGLTTSAILSVQDLNGKVLTEWNNPASAQVVSSQLAYLITDVLSGTFRDRPDSAPNPDIGRPVAFKTSTAQDGTETWAVGYTPFRVAVVWMGSNQQSRSAIPQRASLGLSAAILQSASLDVPPDRWPLPAGMLRLKVCDPSGMLPTAACPNTTDEIFIDGYQPTQADTLYKEYAINRETNLLATVFTPEQLIERHVFMSVPPEARSWAENAKLPVPPIQYDSIQPPMPDPDGNIKSPLMFAELQGKVTISGTAGGKDFSYYRLQYGQGLNPETWTQIGVDVKSPVQSGVLATWDTNGLKGLYSLQLLVIRSDNSLKKATVQVSLTNP